MWLKTSTVKELLSRDFDIHAAPGSRLCFAILRHGIGVSPTPPPRRLSVFPFKNPSRTLPSEIPTLCYSIPLPLKPHTYGCKFRTPSFRPRRPHYQDHRIRNNILLGPFRRKKSEQKPHLDGPLSTRKLYAPLILIFIGLGKSSPCSQP